MIKDVHIVTNDDNKTFHVEYQTLEALKQLSVIDMDNCDFPLNALPIVKKHFKENKLTFVML